MPEENLVKKIKRRLRKEIVPQVIEFHKDGSTLHKLDNGYVYIKTPKKDGWALIGQCYGQTFNVEQSRLVHTLQTPDWERVPIPTIVIGFLNGLGIAKIRVSSITVVEKSFGPIRKESYHVGDAPSLRKLYRDGKRKTTKKTLLGDCILYRTTDFT